MIKKLIYQRQINFILRSLLKPFTSSLPDRFKFPVNGVFTVKGNNIPPFKMLTNPTSAVTKYVFWGNVEGFEFSSVRIYCELVKNSQVFFDIGANIGYYSLLASTLKKTDIIIYAFEPMPSAYDYLLKNIALNNFKAIKPQKLALADKKGNATFYSIANPKFKDLAQLTGDGSLNDYQKSNSSKIEFEVAIDSLDNFVKENLGELKIDLIKLDTEANEHKVLSGAGIVLSEHRPIIQCEILKNQIEKEMEEILNNYNYNYYRATDKGLVLVKSFLNNESRFVDYYLVPKEKNELISKFIIS